MNEPISVFAGTGSFAVPILKTLHDVTEIKLVVSQPPRPSGKNKTLKKNPVVKMAETLKLEIETPEKFEELNATIQSLRPNFLVVADYGQIIPPSTLALADKGVLNVHPSLLPKYRGPSPLETAIMNGDKETGVTVMLLDEKMDHGPILVQTIHKLNGSETTLELKKVLARQGAELLKKIIPDYIAGNLKPRKQNHNEATYTQLLKREDGEINFKEPTKNIYNQFRALTPWPGIWFKTALNNKEKRIKLLDIALTTEEAPRQNIGTFFWKNNKLGLKTFDGALEIKELQVEGSIALNSKEFLAGYKNDIKQ